LVLLAAAGIGGWWMTRPALIGTLRSGDQSYSLIGKRPMVIGSDPKTNILISGENVAPRHAELRAFGDRKNPSVEVRSLDPGNPVLVNGYPETTHTLANGETLRIGDQEFRVEDLPEKDDGIQLDPTPSNDWKL
jgi:pSer/pThr/pTyr-binding forkhead associated (FHA) protein